MNQRTRSPETIRKYIKDASKLAARYERDYRLKGVGLRDWLIDLAKDKRKSTWGGYKAALIEWTRHDKGIGKYQPNEVRSIVESLGREYAQGNGSGTSRQKYKLLPPKIYSKLMTYMASSNGRYDGIISDWLVAGALTGLRPIEWGSAKLTKKIVNNDTYYLLVVENAKRSNGRCFADTRGIILVNPSENEMNAVRNMLKVAKSMRERGLKWESLYTKCRHRLLQINHIIQPRAKKHITLYSPRHQFAADLKANGFSRTEQAALMGHGSTATATIHYARKNHGRKLKHKVLTRNEDIEAVKRWNKDKTDMRQKFENYLKQKEQVKPGVQHDE